MTDGILLAELQRDRDLRRYDTLIIDEAHERSLNIDFILGYLRQLLPRRPDLKVIVTSATIDTARFARHFATRRRRRARRRGDRAHVPGRGPLPPVRRGASTATVDRRDQVQAISDAVDELAGHRRHARVPVRRAGDPRHGRLPAPARPPRHRGAAAVRPAVGAGAAPHLPAPPRPAHRAGHQRRRDVDHRARRALRRRRRHGAHLPLQPAVEGAATADRAGVAGVGRPAGRPLRSRRAGRLHPAVRRGGLRRPARVHRAGDPAHQPGLRHPADDGDRARRRRRRSRSSSRPTTRRSATATCCSRSSARSRRPTTDGAPAADADRPPPGPAAGRPAPRAAWSSRRSATAACARCS